MKLSNTKIQNRIETINPLIISLVGAIFPLIAWIIDFSKKDLSFTFENIKLIHAENSIIWVLYSAPFILYWLSSYAKKVVVLSSNILNEELKEKDETINRNAEFAKNIGEGNLDAELISDDKKDILGQSLLRMRDNLLENHKNETDQAWKAKGTDLISTILRIHNDIENLSYDVIVNLIKYVDAIQGALYIYDDEEKVLENFATYAYNRKKYISQKFKIGQGLIGQCAYEEDFIYMTKLPEDYATITSGILGDKKPGSILLVPLIAEEKLQGVIEFATLEDEIPVLTREYVIELSEIIARTIYNLNINKRTEQLLQESQKMTEELRENERTLNENAEQMRMTQEELKESNEQLEQKINEVQNGQKRLHSLLENASEVISIYDKDKTTKYESPSVEKILGYKAKDAIGKKGFSQLNDSGKEKIDQLFAYIIENPEESNTVEFIFKNPQGDEMWLEAQGRNLLNDPAIHGIIINTRDITQNKIAEEEQRMRGKMQALSENSPDIIIRLGLEGYVYYLNPMVAEYTGIDIIEVFEKNIQDSDIDHAIVEFFIEQIEIIKKTNDKINVETTFPSINGDRIMTVNAIPEYTEDGELETILFVAHDITEAKKIELEIKETSKKIKESINYAYRIQTAILPDNQVINEYFPKSFIYYRPRDVVSGDFPWFFPKDDITYISAVDCTGHGVPGALLSFIGYFILNNVVDKYDGLTSGVILDLMHAGVRKTLRQDSGNTEARDGMDIAFCKIDRKQMKMEYSGAHRPLYLLRQGELIQYKGNPKAIGGIPLGKKKEKDFVTHFIDLEKGDKIFFFSDGMPDQFGGPKGRKYSPKRIRDIITDNAEATMSQYDGIFDKDVRTWMKNTHQVDDILLIGIEF